MHTSDVPTAEQGGEQPVRYLLFVRNHNAGRSHAMTLAHRQTRKCLCRDTGDLIAARERS